MLVLLILAGCYYGSYYRHGINFRDEGGTLVLLGKRLHDGQVPFKDVVLGYNVGWFYPIVALFKVTGVNFVALRVFCFCLSTLAALLGFLTVHRVARHTGMGLSANVVAFAVAVILILVPGMTFKNYNPLAVVANIWCITNFVLTPLDKRQVLLRAGIGGLVLGATWLTRIDLGTFFTFLWVGACIARIVADRLAFAQRALVATVSLALVTTGIAVMHAPVVWDAKSRGFYEPFVAQYPAFWKSIGLNLQIRSSSKKGEVGSDATAQPKSEVSQPAAPAKPEKQHSWSGEILGRTTWTDVQKAKEKEKSDVLGLYLLTWIPILTLVALVFWAVVRWFKAVRKSGEDPSVPLSALVLIGGSLTMFPQFFFWRPDSPHLSEFGPGFFVALAGAVILLASKSAPMILRISLAVVVGLNVALYMWRMFPDRWAGTIAAKGNRNTLFEGENGTRLYVHRREADWMNSVLGLIRKHSGPKDYLLAYPYHPSFNVIADRPTYEKNVYVDNATAKPGWDKSAIERIKKEQPAVIIIGDWAINGTDKSRFRNWADTTYQYVRANYAFMGEYDGKEKFEVFVRRKE